MHRLLALLQRLSTHAGAALVGTICLSSLSALLSTALSVWLFLALCGTALFQFVLAEIPGRPSRFERVSPHQVERESSSLREPLLWASCALPTLALLSPALCAAVASLFLFSQRHGLLVWAQSILRKKRDSSQNQQEYRQAEYEIAVHIAGPADSAYQINQWLPVLEQLPQRVCILTRKLELVAKIRPTTLPIYYAKTHSQASWFLTHGPRIALYTASSSENSQALRECQLTHIMLNHGESDKIVSQSKFLMAFDRLFLAGPLAERRLRQAGLPLRPEQVVFVGRPQAEMFLTRQTTPSPLRKILYAPTWEGTSDNANYTSVQAQGVQLVRALIARREELGIELLFKPHPYTGMRKATTRQALQEILTLCRAASVRVLEPHDSIYEAMNWSDALVTDVSSVLNDYLITQKPILLCNTLGLSEAELLQNFPSSQAAAPLHPGQDITVLLQSLRTEDPWAPHREHLRRDSLGDFPEPALERFKQTLSSLLLPSAPSQRA